MTLNGAIKKRYHKFLYIIPLPIYTSLTVNLHFTIIIVMKKSVLLVMRRIMTLNGAIKKR